jgi:hypothetical protein
MRRNYYIGKRSVGFLILLCLLQVFSLSCGEAVADGENTRTNKEQTPKAMPISSLILPLAEIVSGEAPTLEAIEKHFGMRAIEEKEAKNNFTLNVAGYEIITYAPKINDNRPLEVNIHTNDQYLQFKEVEAVLGKWSSLYESKTSCVIFLYKNTRTDKPISIFVDLLDPPRYPKSMVLHILMRSGEVPDSILERFR